MVRFILGMLILGSLSGEGYYAVIYGSELVLELYDSVDVFVKSYSVGLGRNGMGKMCEGDEKTPVGEYEIVWKASVFAEEDGGYLILEGAAFCAPDNRFTRNPGEADPDEKLWTAAYGDDRAVVLGLNYPNLWDKNRGCTGGCIEIHAALEGVGEWSSAGCPRMKPEDARDLYHYLQVGSRVVIYD